MESVKVKRSDLLDRVRKNRATHRGIFEQAQSAYRAKAIELLDGMLKDARHGGKFARAVMIPEPEDHTEDYDRVIAMLEMSVDDEVEIGAHQFDQYVMDRWEWARSFGQTTLSYLKK